MTAVLARTLAARPARALPRMPVLALLLVAAGCANLERYVTDGNNGSDGLPAYGGSSRDQRELEMNRQWRNRPLAELLATVGEPRLTMNIPGGGNPPGFVVVYPQDSRTGCIDAFAISAGSAREPMVRAYHCR